jgi:hypothetical protein
MANTNIAPQGLFGPGILYLTRTDIANGTPANVGFVNEFQYDFAGETKDLSGQNQFPLLIARGPIKATGKIKAATMSGLALNTVLIGGAWTAGTQYDIFSTPATAIPTTPFQITPTIPSSGAFDTDLGVINAATGVPMTKVASGPVAGQYSQAAGIYTFSSADNVSGISVIISVAYHFTTGATGQFQIVQNQLIGTTPTFQLDYKTILYGATYYVRFYNCVGSKVAMAHKLTDFAMPEYDFGFFANAAQQVMLISLATQA